MSLPVALALVGCGKTPGPSSDSRTAGSLTGSDLDAHSVDGTPVRTDPGPPPPAAPDDYGIWVNNVPAQYAPVSVPAGSPAKFTVDQFDPASSVRVLGAGVRTTTTADDHGRVEFSIDTGDLGAGVHTVRFDGGHGVDIGFSGRFQLPGLPRVGDDYATVLCCLDLPPDDTLLEDVPLQLTVNGTDFTGFVPVHLDYDGSVLISIPVPNVDNLKFEITNTTTGQTLEAEIRTRPS